MSGGVGELDGVDGIEIFGQDVRDDECLFETVRFLSTGERYRGYDIGIHTLL